MTDEQKKAIIALDRVREKMDVDEYILILEFIMQQVKVEYVPQPSAPWPTPEIKPYYGGGTADPLQPPSYTVYCEQTKK